MVKLKCEKNILYIANRFDKELLYKKELTVKNINRISRSASKFSLKCKARIRYLHSQINCVVIKLGKKVRAKFNQKQRATTPGQSVVFYSST